jgi:hypothetical protein
VRAKYETGDNVLSICSGDEQHKQKTNRHHIVYCTISQHCRDKKLVCVQADADPTTMMKMIRSIRSVLLIAMYMLSSPSHGFMLQSPTSISLKLATRSSLQMVSSLKAPGTAKLDTPWAELGFEFRPTNSHIKLTWKDGEWGKPELVKVRHY